MVLVTLWSSGHFQIYHEQSAFRSALEWCKKHFHSLEENFKHYLRIYEQLVKILSLVIRISEFPVNMHNFRPIKRNIPSDRYVSLKL